MNFQLIVGNTSGNKKRLLGFFYISFDFIKLATFRKRLKKLQMSDFVFHMERHPQQIKIKTFITKGTRLAKCKIV